MDRAQDIARRTAAAALAFASFAGCEPSIEGTDTGACAPAVGEAQADEVAVAVLDPYRVGLHGMVGPGDVDGDGQDDLVVGTTGDLLVVPGPLTGTRRLDGTALPFEAVEVRAAGDLDGDGLQDVLALHVGDWQTDGAVAVVLGPGEIVATLEGDPDHDRLGEAAALQADGALWITSLAGIVRVPDPLTPGTRAAWDASDARILVPDVLPYDAWVPNALLAGDLTGDGVDDLLVGFSGHAARLYPGPFAGDVDGTTAGFDVTEPTFTEQRFADLGDLDGPDGSGGWLVAVCGEVPRPDLPRCDVFAPPIAAGAQPIGAVRGPIAGSSPWSIAAVPDLDGDGVPELAVGSVLDPDAPLPGAGGVRLIDGAAVAAGGDVDVAGAWRSVWGTWGSTEEYCYGTSPTSGPACADADIGENLNGATSGGDLDGDGAPDLLARSGRETVDHDIVLYVLGGSCPSPAP